jgi:hypothetical protein
MPAMPADSDTLSCLPCGNTIADFINNAGHFVPRNAWILNSWQHAFFDKHITVANATGLYLDPHVPGTRLWNFAFNDLKRRSGFCNLRCFHARCFRFRDYSYRCH